MNKLLLHLEGFCVLLLCLYFYAQFHFSWLLFAIFLLAPDLSVLPYLFNVKVGAVIYNIFHTYIVPSMLLLIGLFTKLDVCIIVSLIWLAHIGMDRMCGFGLKYPTTFQDTHLNRV